MTGKIITINHNINQYIDNYKQSNNPILYLLNNIDFLDYIIYDKSNINIIYTSIKNEYINLSNLLINYMENNIINYQINDINRLLVEEYGTATNIKSRINRLAMLDAITSALQKLKQYSCISPNRLILYTGNIITDLGKEKRIIISFEPTKPLLTSLVIINFIQIN